jgi:hypothetical protein
MKKKKKMYLQEDNGEGHGIYKRSMGVISYTRRGGSGE